MADKILIVDDDPEFRSELKEALDDYEVIEASEGRQALKILDRANEIKAVLMDVNMPGPSGTDVLREIKKNDPEMGIIILTGYSTKDVAIEALKGKADDYIEKPFDVEKIKETIERVMASRRPASAIDINNIKGKIEKVKDFTLRNCFKKLALEDAARSICVSPKYLSRIFKEETGQSFSSYKLKIKVDKAKELLAKSGYNVNQIADKLGYENTESFIRQFKKLTRSTPTGYREKVQRKKR